MKVSALRSHWKAGIFQHLHAWLMAAFVLSTLQCCGQSVAADESLSDTALRNAVDFSGVDAFWPVMHKLSAGQEPKEGEWSAMLDSPAYASLARNAALQRDMRLAFMPGLKEEFASVAAQDDYHSQVLKHLRRFADEEKAIQQYQSSFDAPSVLRSALERCSVYLPSGTLHAKPLPHVMFLAFEPDGHADGDWVIMDVLFAKMHSDEGIRDLLAHEFHHYYNPSRLESPERNSQDYKIVHAVKQLQMEGIADLIDKKAYPIHSPNAAAEEQYNRAYAVAPETLRGFDRLASEIADHPEKMRDNGEMIWRSLVLAGHPVGLYMASHIVQNLGKEALINSESDPFEFVWLYNRSIKACGECTHFSAKSLSVLSGLRTKYLHKSESATAGATHGEPRKRQIRPLPFD